MKPVLTHKDLIHDNFNNSYISTFYFFIFISQAFVLKYLLFFPQELVKGVQNTPMKSISRRLQENQDSVSNIFGSLTEETKSR